MNFQEASYKPIFGLEVDLEEGTLVLLAKDNRGHQVLSRLSIYSVKRLHLL